jgi:hypothetical protein
VVYTHYIYARGEELDGQSVSALNLQSRKLSNVRKGQSSDVVYREVLRASEGTLSRASRLHLQL